jgi:putative transposase
MILPALRQRWPWMKRLFADSAYGRGKLVDKAAYLDFTIEASDASTTSLGSMFCRDAGSSSGPSVG